MKNKTFKKVFSICCLLILTMCMMGVVNAATFILDPNGTSHLYWIFSYGDWYATGGSSLHIGDDYYADDWFQNDGTQLGENAYADAPGTVIYAGASPSGWGYGNQVVVQCSGNANFAYRYAHLQSVSVSVGQSVSRYTVLGKVGSSGTSSAHLHSVLYKNINSTTPLNYLKAGKSPSGFINGASGPSSYATPFYNDAQ